MKDAESARAFKLKEIEREAEKERAYKELELKEAESVRAFKLQEQQLQLQAAMLRFFENKENKTNGKGNTNNDG